MTAKTIGIRIDGKPYNLVQDHDTYKVSDVPAHPDADPRMERRVIYEDFTKGILTRKENRLEDQSIASLNVYNRITKAGQGLWWSEGCDTRMADRVYGQRAAASSTGLASQFVTAGTYQGVDYIVCQKHIYTVTGVSGGIEQLSLAKDFTAIGLITGVVGFNKNLYVAVCTANAGLPDFNQSQKFWVWDLGSTWTQAPTPLAQPQWGATPLTVVGTAGTTQYSYYVVAVGAGIDSKPSTIQTVATGPASLNGTNYITLTWQAVTGATSYKVFRYSTGNGNLSTGVIAENIAGTTYNDQGGDVVDLLYTQTPAYATTDTGLGSCFAVIRGTLWRAAGAKMWAWDGVQATWSGESIIGEPGSYITALDSYNDGLVIFKNDGVFTMDRTGTVFPLFPGFKNSGFNPRPLGQWRGSYYLASDVGMIWEWDDNQGVKKIGFDSAEAYPMPDGTYGLPNAVGRGVSLPNALVVAFRIWNGTSNFAYFLAYDGTGWHPYYYTNQYIATGVGVTTGSMLNPAPKLQLGLAKVDSSAFTVWYIDKPTIDPVLATAFDTGTQYLYLPVDSGIITDEFKVLEGVRVYVENSTAGTIRVQYAVDDDIYALNFTDLGAPVGDRTSTQSFIPSGSLPPYRKILFRISVAADTAAATPIVKSVIQRYKQRELQRRCWDLTLFLEENQMMPNRTIDKRTAAKMLSDLNTARRNKKQVSFTDLVGSTYNVYVEAVNEKMKSYKNLNLGLSFVVEVRLVEAATLN